MFCSWSAWRDCVFGNKFETFGVNYNISHFVIICCFEVLFHVSCYEFFKDLSANVCVPVLLEKSWIFSQAAGSMSHLLLCVSSHLLLLQKLCCILICLDSWMYSAVFINYYNPNINSNNPFSRTDDDVFSYPKIFKEQGKVIQYLIVLPTLRCPGIYLAPRLTHTIKAITKILSDVHQLLCTVDKYDTINM